MKQTRAAGVLVFRREEKLSLIVNEPKLSFLLMEHRNRLDLPKGHVDPGETDQQCALRELEEETGVRADDIQLDSDFQFVIEYDVRYKKRFGAPVVAHKTVVYFLGFLNRPVDIVLTEHPGYRWEKWNPPHQLQKETIDPLLAAVQEHFEHNPLS